VDKVIHTPYFQAKQTGLISLADPHSFEQQLEVVGDSLDAKYTFCDKLLVKKV